MKKSILGLVAATMVAGVLGGCAYGGIAGVGDKAVITRNDAFLFGILRKVFVCKVADSGVSNCNESEAP